MTHEEAQAKYDLMKGKVRPEGFSICLPTWAVIKGRKPRAFLRAFRISVGPKWSRVSILERNRLREVSDG